MKGIIKERIDSYLKSKGYSVDYAIEHPKSEKFGDYSTNFAMKLASLLKRNPRDVAKEFVDWVDRDIFDRIDVAGGGFVNFYIKREAFINELLRMHELGDEYFKPEITEKKYIQVEFVSANPTGPLHVGHGRGAAIGDSIARLLKFCGHRVEREYYINDAGLQMELLGRSVYVRYKQLLGMDDELPEDGYRGEYLVDIAKQIMVEYGENLLKMDEDEAIELCKGRASDVILNKIMSVLRDFRVEFDVVFNEKRLYESGEVDESIDYLMQKGLVYEKEGALWFKSSLFGDDKDRVLKRSNGVFTYFASDVAYHRNKFLKRGFDEVVDVWGSDHHGYVKRVKAAVEAFGVNPDRLRVILVQIVNLLRDGKKVSMSTRKGEFVELEDVIGEVGVDAARFMFVSRSVDSHLDFDLELAKKESSENPVYYVQYAHARINSIFEQLDKLDLDRDSVYNLNEKEEIDLIKSIIQLKEFIEKAYLDIEPYFIVKGLLGVAEKFHRFYNRHRVIGSKEPIFKARLLLIWCVAKALRLGLDIIGVEARKKM